MTGRPRLGFAAAALLLLTACGAASEGDSGAGASPASVAAADSAAASAPESAPESAPGTVAASVPDILQFQASLVGGGAYDGAAAAGKVTAYWFWAPT